MLLYYLLRAGRNKKIKLKFKFLLHEKDFFVKGFTTYGKELL